MTEDPAKAAADGDDAVVQLTHLDWFFQFKSALPSTRRSARWGLFLAKASALRFNIDLEYQIHSGMFTFKN